MNKETGNIKTWLILGGSSSVARAFARRAAAKGADILLAGRDIDDLERTASDVAIRHAVKAEALSFDAEATRRHDDFMRRIDDIPRPLGVFLLFGTMDIIFDIFHAKQPFENL